MSAHRAQDVAQLNWLTFPRHALDQPGHELAEVVASLERIDYRAEVDDLPRTGWILLEDIKRPLTRRTYAAKRKGGDWALLSLAYTEGVWLLSSDPGPVALKTPRSWALDLALEWPREIIHIPAAATHVEIIVANTSRKVLTVSEGDLALVAWLVSPGRQSQVCNATYSHFDGEIRIRPGGAIVRLAKLLTPSGSFPPGRYTLRAAAFGLGLRSQEIRALVGGNSSPNAF